MEKIFARVSGDIAVLKEAKNYEEFRNAYMDYVEADTELETSKTVAHLFFQDFIFRHLAVGI